MEQNIKEFSFGIGLFVSTGGSSYGNAKAEVTVAAILLGEDGRIADVAVDLAESCLPVYGGMIAGTDRTTIFRTRFEKREQYGKRKGQESWCDEAEDFCARIKEMNFDEVAALSEKNALIEAIKKARENCGKRFCAKEGGCRVKLASVSWIGSNSKNATAEHAGSADLYSDFVGVVLDDKNRILVAMATTARPQIQFSSNGAILETLFPKESEEKEKIDKINEDLSDLIGYTSEGARLRADEKEELVRPYWNLAVKAAVCHQKVLVNSDWHVPGEKVTIPISDIQNDRFAAFKTGDLITYRPLTEEERAAGKIELNAEVDTSVKFYRYGLFIDDRCVIAGDTEQNRILLSDFLLDQDKNCYCFGYDENSGSIDTDLVGCMCATNDLWKVYHIRHIYTGYFQVQVNIPKNVTLIMKNKETAYQAAPIPPGAVFPFCDADNPKHLPPSPDGVQIEAGTYYVKKGTVFETKDQRAIINQNQKLIF